MKRLLTPGITAVALLTEALLVFGLVLSLWNATQLHVDNRWVIHTQNVMNRLESVVGHASHANSAERAYSLTGDRQYATTYASAVEEAYRNVDELQTLLVDNPAQTGPLKKLREQLDHRFKGRAPAGPTSLTNQRARDDAELTAIADVAAIRDTVAHMTVTEQGLLEERTHHADQAYVGLKVADVILGLASLAAITALLLLVRSHTKALAAVSANLQIQAERLRTTLASIGDGVLVTDADGNVTTMNPVAEALTGWTDAEAQGVPLGTVFKIVNETTRATVENPALRALQEGRIVGLANHTVLIAKDGEEHPIDDSAAPVKDASGAVTGSVLVFRDIAERRAIEKAQAILASIVSDSDDAIVSKNLDGTIVTWNSGAERVFGYTAEEAVGQSIRMVIPNELWGEEESILSRLRNGERIDHFETTRVAKDGSRIHVSLTVSPLRDYTGAVIGASKVARDVTLRKKSEADMRFLTGASAVLAGIHEDTKALETVAQLAVPAFADWCSVSMLTKEGDLELIALAHIDPAKVEMARELQRKFPARPEASVGAWHVIKSGQPVLVSDVTEDFLSTAIKEPDRVQAVRDIGAKSYMAVPIQAHGNTIGVLSFVAGDSGRRYGETDLATAQDLAHRTAVAVENARLYSELREADDKKDRFLATLAHELRNPLAPMRYALDIIRSSKPGDISFHQAVDIFERQLGQLVRLVDDLLDIRRISQDKLELRRAHLEVAVVVKQAIETVQPSLVAKEQILSVVIPDHSVVVDADPTRLIQVLSNLLNNACKFTPNGGHIEISVQASDRAVEIVVKDDGIGIPRTDLRDIFEMFTQLDDTHDETKSGLGIGLTLVRQLVEMHGGTVSADSEGLGKGSTFTVHLPRPHEAAESAALHAPEGAAAAGTAKRVLIVDDNRDAAHMLHVLLGGSGHITEVAHDGNRAIELARDFKPDVILLDIGLPHVSGYEVARAIRREPWGESILLVALTGWGQARDRHESSEAGFDVHLVKPVTPSELAKLLDAHTP